MIGSVPLSSQSTRTRTTKVIHVIVVLFLLLLGMSAVASGLGTQTGDDHGDQARPDQVWYPPVGIH